MMTMRMTMGRTLPSFFLERCATIEPSVSLLCNRERGPPPLFIFFFFFFPSLTQNAEGLCKNGSEKRQKLHVSTAVDMAFQVHQGLCMIFLPLLLSLRPAPPPLFLWELSGYLLFVRYPNITQSISRQSRDRRRCFFSPSPGGKRNLRARR